MLCSDVLPRMLSWTSPRDPAVYPTLPVCFLCGGIICNSAHFCRPLDVFWFVSDVRREHSCAVFMPFVALDFALLKKNRNKKTVSASREHWTQSGNHDTVAGLGPRDPF